MLSKFPKYDIIDNNFKFCHRNANSTGYDIRNNRLAQRAGMLIGVKYGDLL